MSLSKEDLEYYKKNIISECKSITPWKAKVFKMWLEFKDENKCASEEIARTLKVEVHYVDSALYVVLHSMRKWVEKQDLSKDEVEEVINEIFK